MRLSPFAALILIAALSAPALAQAPPSSPPAFIRGTVQNFSDHNLTIKSSAGPPVTVTLARDFRVRSVVAKTLADIKPGDKVGITSVMGENGIRKALEVHIFPASMSTVKMGEIPWNLASGSLMTNAPVAEVSSKPGGDMIKVTLDGKESEIAVPPNTPIVTYGPGDPSLLKPGAAVFVVARKGATGGLTAAGVTAEKNGVKPPM